MSSGLPYQWKLRESKSRPGVVYYITPAGKSQWSEPSEKQIRKAKEAESKKNNNGGDNKRSRSDSSSSNNKRAKVTSSSSSKDQVQVLHLLKKHTESRNPMRSGKPITRTKEEAISELNELLVGLNEVEKEELESTFRQFAESESDCSSRRNGGDLGLFSKGAMQPPFEKAAFNLEVGDMTKELVYTASGIHIILRIK